MDFPHVHKHKLHECVHGQGRKCITQSSGTGLKGSKPSVLENGVFILYRKIIISLGQYWWHKLSQCFYKEQATPVFAIFPCMWCWRKPTHSNWKCQWTVFTSNHNVMQVKENASWTLTQKPCCILREQRPRGVIAKRLRRLGAKLALKTGRGGSHFSELRGEDRSLFIVWELKINQSRHDRQDQRKENAQF